MIMIRTIIILVVVIIIIYIYHYVCHVCNHDDDVGQCDE